MTSKSSYDLVGVVAAAHSASHHSWLGTVDGTAKGTMPYKDRTRHFSRCDEQHACCVPYDKEKYEAHRLDKNSKLAD